MLPERDRISVVRDDRLVPLFTSAGPALSRKQPWAGVLLERHAVKPSEIPEHEHREFCLHLQESGQDDFEWWSEGRNRIERTMPGKLILLPPGTRDRLRWHGASQRLIVSIKPEVLASLAAEVGAKSAPEFLAHWSFESDALKNLVAEMGREAASGWPLGSLYADLLGVSLSRHLLRRHAVEPVAMPELRGGLPMSRLRAAMEYLHEHLGDDVRLEAVAQELGLSAFHFAHQFRSSTGQTPYQYLMDQRMARAKWLLESTKWSVQEVGGQVGFGSSVNFVRAFRQRVGMTPGAWRTESSA